ncbi:hypothetical protein EDD29_1491 [Actinocorallia herbida]|uniref:DUF2567 domain-containing protein n=1 Tax=Actinocorallia herbida TaxID=58109 RepID=A0A3N1CRP2_9ACTN|nr:hypothetical protein [Actinocorallia herbida]ROO83981.1 hypothetical protein EDD29_1491 [Actinocorallia herbida]
MARQLRVWATLTGTLALVGVPAGLLWVWLAVRPEYIIVSGKAHLLDPETQDLIGADGRFAAVCAAFGLAAGALAYWRGGRGRDVALVLALGTGGLLGSFVAWWLGHRFGLAAFTRAVASGADGTRVLGPLDLQAKGVLTLWPLVSVIAFGVLEALDVARRLPAADGGQPGAGEADEVGGGEFDLEAAPPGGDVDGRER